jgi:hypothetical protein
MALKIRTAADPINVSSLCLVVYSPPGLGKTTLGFTANAPLLLDFDGGAHRAPNRADSVRIEKWPEATDITDEDLAPYSSLVVDTAGRALDSLTLDIIKRDAKAGKSGVLSQQGWGKLKGEFSGWMNARRAHGKDIILLAHMSEKPQGDDMIERLDVQGGSKEEIYKSADAMARIVIRDGKRWLMFDPTETAYGKNPGQLPPIEIPHPLPKTFLGDIIERIKAHLNAETEAQRERAELLMKWQERAAKLKTPEDFNGVLAEVRALPRPVQKVVADRAAAAGLIFEAGAYRAQEQPAAEAKQPEAAEAATEAEAPVQKPRRSRGV